METLSALPVTFQCIKRGFACKRVHETKSAGKIAATLKPFA